MRESAFGIDPTAFSAENIYQHLLCARSLMGNRDESDLVCPGRARNHEIMSPQHWLRPWDGVSGWAVRTPVLAGDPGDLRKGASAHGCSWMAFFPSCPFPYQRDPSFQTFYLLAPLKPGSASFPKTHQEASQVFGYLRSWASLLSFLESILPSLYSGVIVSGGQR